MKSSAQRGTYWVFCSAVALCMALLVWAHYGYLTRPGRYSDRDFMTLWCGGRAILEGLNAYDPGDWLPLRAQYGSTWMPNQQVPYPLWTLVLMTPFSALGVDWGTACWLVFSEGLLGASVYLLVSEVGHDRPSPVAFALLLLGGFVTRGTLLTLHVGQITIVLLFALTLFLVLMERERPLVAGMALALTALKPNPFLLLVPLLGVWLLWRRRWRVLLGAVAGGAVLLGTTSLMRPGWFLEWLAVRGKAVAAYRTPTLWGLAHSLSPERWPLFGLLGTVVVTAIVGWAVFRRPDCRAPEVASLGLAGSLLVTPYAWSYEHALLLVPLVLLATRLHSRWVMWALWESLVVALPWAFYWAATRTDSDALSAFVPAIVGVAFGIAALRPVARVRLGQLEPPRRASDEVC